MRTLTDSGRTQSEKGPLPFLKAVTKGNQAEPDSFKVGNQSKERWNTAVKSAEIWSQKGKTDRKKGGFNQHERWKPF